MGGVAFGEGAGLRVFVSHTSEFREFPRGGSYVAAVERAVSACGHVVVDMADFPAGDLPPAELCAERVQSCDVYVGVLGTRYGSPVRERPELSYTELEFEAATEAGLKRLVFLLDTKAEETGIPASGLVDLEFGARQEQFRRRVRDSGLVTQSFSDPAVLGQLVERSLRELSRRPVTGTSAGGVSAAGVPLGAAARDPGAVFTAVGLSGFTGREWLAAGVDEFMAANPCGYVLIEAEAGLGKTAFAAWLVKTRGYLTHFSRYSAGTSVPGALGNLAAQLIMRFGLDEQAPGGMLPEWARTPEGFESLLGTAARAAGRRGPVVLVADGLDEADAPAGGLPFGLPLLLPDGVFVIGTYRTGRSPRRPDAPFTVLAIGRQDPRNRHDIDEYLAGQAAEEVLAARLAEAGTDPAAFTAVLAQRCGGVWVYLRYVLQELRIGLRRPDEVSDLPAGLHSYYADQVRRWQQGPAWQAGLLPLLATLGAAGEPLTAATLARLAGDLDAADAQRWCNLTVRPLLTTVRQPGAGGPLRYEIYHASFRELLNGSAGDWPGSPSDQGYELVVLAGELGQATAAAHFRISNIYLERFGGLDAGLPVLAADPAAAGIDGGYPLRHLARHLCAAGRAQDLHSLLAAGHPAGGDRAVNTWFAAHDYADTVTGYLADIALARADSAAAADRDLSAGHPAPALGMEIRYALIAASIASMAGKIPADLLGHLIRMKVWSPRRGLDHARRIVDSRSRLDALLAVCGQLDAEDQPPVLAQALAAATAITDDFARAQALTGIAPHLPADLLAQALAAATAITGDAARAAVLTGLAPQLPEADQPPVLAQALAAATAITDNAARAAVLTGLAPQLPEADRPPVLAQALAAATAITDNAARAAVLTGLAPQLPEADQPPVLARALAAATAITNAPDRAQALTGIAPQLPEADRPPVLARALAAATTITNDFFRARALTGLARQLPEADQPPVLARALAAATAITDDAARAQALTGIAPHLPADLLAQALAAATAITDDAARARALTGLARQLPEADQPPVLARALAAATAITGDSDRARALTGLARQLPEADQPPVLARALAAATAITRDYYRAQALTGIAPHLPADLLAQALAAATAITGDAARAEALTGLAPQLPADLLARALAAATAITNDSDRARALTGIAPQLPQADRPPVLAQALAAATTGAGDSDRATVLTGLARQLPEADRTPVLARALAAATAIPRDSDRARALTGLAPQLPEADRPPVLAQALAAATAITDDFARARALTGIAPQLPADLLARALAAATTITRDYYRAQALTGIAPQLPADLLAQALAAATAITNDSDRARALTGLAPQLPEADRTPVLARALAAATAITNDSDRARALTGLAPQLPEADRTPVLARALAAATAITRDSDRAQALTGLAPQLPADLLAQAQGSAPRDQQTLVALLERAWAVHTRGAPLTYVASLRDCLTGINRDACLGILVAAAPAIAATGGIAALRQCAHGVSDVYLWWP